MRTSIRVILAIDRLLLREVLQRILTRAGLEVLPRPQDPVRLLCSMAALHVDAVVFWTANCSDRPGICSHLLYEYPRLKIVLLSSVDCVVTGAGVETPRHPELSAAGILAALRD